MSRDEMGTLKLGLVGNWENSLDSFSSPMELEAWRLKGNLMVAHVNDVQFFLEFTILEEAKWVMESRSRMREEFRDTRGRVD